MLSLIYGKGQYLFCGDVQQLPPVILGARQVEDETLPERSILAHLLATYDHTVRVRLNQTYRLNQELCQLPSRLWYQGDLRPAAANACSFEILYVRNGISPHRCARVRPRETARQW